MKSVVSPSLFSLLIALVCVACSSSERLSPKQRGDKEHEFTGTQTVEASIDFSGWGSPRPEKVGFDQIEPIFRDPAYGSCARCHASQWPYLGSDFAKLKSSVPYKKRKIQSLLDLAKFITDCSDMDEQSKCTGDPDDPSDNHEYKMPTKFGFAKLSATHVAKLRQWSNDGASEKSCEPLLPFEPAKMSDMKLLNAMGQVVGDVESWSIESEINRLILKVRHDETEIIESFTSAMAGFEQKFRAELKMIEPITDFSFIAVNPACP
jgi:hypothetical protein